MSMLPSKAIQVNSARAAYQARNAVGGRFSEGAIRMNAIAITSATAIRMYSPRFTL